MSFRKITMLLLHHSRNSTSELTIINPDMCAIKRTGVATATLVTSYSIRGFHLKRYTFMLTVLDQSLAGGYDHIADRK